MPFDADLLLRDGLVDLDASEALATSTTRNDDGAVVLDLKETGASGMSAIMTLPTAPTTYEDTLTVLIQESESLDRNWRTVGAFEVVQALLYRLRDCTATTAFVAADVTTPRVLTATGDGATGKIWKVDQELFTVGGVGDIYVIMVDAADVYGTASDTLTATSGTGVATQGPIGESWRQKILVCRFGTTQRYLRHSATVSSGGNFGKVLIGLQGHAFRTI